MSQKNSDLVMLQKHLIALVDDLARKQEEATTAEEIIAIGREIVEVSHRVTMVGRVVFKERTEKMSAAVQAVLEEKKSVEAAIESIEKINTFIKTITKFLGLVDKIVDTAKLLA